MYIDAHAHLDQFKENIGTALKIINGERILTLGCSMDIASYRFTKEISSSSEFIIPAFGIHPWKAAENLDMLGECDKLISEAACIGEIGLDFYWDTNKENYPAQYEVFEHMLDRCRLYGKVSNIHTKGAENDVLRLLKSYNVISPIIHWYSGEIDILKKMIDLGCSFTVSVDAGISKATRELIKLVPSELLLTETDGPNSLVWVNGKYGYPDEVKNIVRSIAEIKNTEVEKMRDIINSNFIKKLNLFKERKE
jgi:TatD DNase family protein